MLRWTHLSDFHEWECWRFRPSEIMERREFIALLGTPAYAELARRIGLQTTPLNPKADVTIRISPIEIEVAPRKVIKTTGYNGWAPGPVLRPHEGQPVMVDVFNETRIPELVHWHGLFVPSEVDGSEEEGTPLVPPGGGRRYSFIPRPSGTRWYHSHVHAGRDMKRATVHGTIRIPLHRTERKAGAVRRGGLSGATRMGPLSRQPGR